MSGFSRDDLDRLELAIEYNAELLTLERIKALTRNDVLLHVELTNADGSPQRWRVNGKVQTWKTRPNDFKVPLKRGLWEYDYLTPDNAHQFMLSSE